nr:hypothetical protein [Rhodoferax sp.]
MADLLFTVEDQFPIILPPEQVALPTLGDAVTFIDGLIGAQSGRIVHPKHVAAKTLLTA